MYNWSAVRSDTETHAGRFPVLGRMLAGLWAQCVYVCVWQGRSMCAHAFHSVSDSSQLSASLCLSLPCPLSVCLPVFLHVPFALCLNAIHCPQPLYPTDITRYTGVIAARKTSTRVRNDDSVDLCIFNTHTHTHTHTHSLSTSCLLCLEVCWEVGMLLRGGGGKEKPELTYWPIHLPTAHFNSTVTGAAFRACVCFCVKSVNELARNPLTGEQHIIKRML